MKKQVVILAMLCFALLFVSAANADSIAISVTAGSDTLTGTLYGTPNGNGTWTIWGINALYDGIQASGIIPTGTDPRFVYDNLYYYPPNPVYWDNAGLLFTVPTVGEINLCWYVGGNCGNGPLYTFIIWDGTGYTFNSVDSYSFGAPVPEPSTMLLMGSSLVAAAGSLRRRLMR